MVSTPPTCRPRASVSLAGLLVLTVCAAPPVCAKPPQVLLRAAAQPDARDIDRVGFREPSGICFHTRRGTLFVVGDKGDVAEWKTDGTRLKAARLPQADLGGITHDPLTGLLYAAVEGEDNILELDPDSLALRRTFSISRKLNGKTVLKKDGGGIEAIAFVPDAAHPEGGTFYVGNQAASPDSPRDLSAVFEVEVPLKSRGSHAHILRSLDAEVDDIADLHYDSASGLLYLLSDQANRLVAMSRRGEWRQAWDLPGDRQEGFTIDSQGNLYVAQDSGGILKLGWRDLTPRPR